MPVKSFTFCLFIVVCSFRGFSQSAKPALAPSAGPGWTTEKFSLPPSFAPDLPVKGMEVARFSPEWAKKNTGGYWTYGFVWALEQTAVPSKVTLEQDLRDYYTGLVISNLVRAKIDIKYALPVNVKLYPVNKSKPDQHAYEGSIKMLDYMTQDPVTLNVRVQILRSTGQQVLIYFEVSPKGFDDEVWGELDEMDIKL
jgi:hypothetical protein